MGEQTEGVWPLQTGESKESGPQSLRAWLVVGGGIQVKSLIRARDSGYRVRAEWSRVSLHLRSVSTLKPQCSGSVLGRDTIFPHSVPYLAAPPLQQVLWTLQ